MKMKRFQLLRSACILTVFAVITMTAPGNSYGFGFKIKSPVKSLTKNPVQNLTGDNSEKDEETAIEDIEDTMTKILRNMSAAKKIEEYGNNMLAISYFSIIESNKIFEKSNELIEVTANMVTQIANIEDGSTVLNSNAEKFFKQSREVDKKYDGYIATLKCYKKDLDDKEQENGPCSEVGKKKESITEVTSTLQGSLGTANVDDERRNEELDKISNEIKVIENNVDAAKENAQFLFDEFAKNADSTKQAVENFSKNFVWPAINDIGTAVGFMKELQTMFPAIYDQMDKIDAFVKKNGKLLVMEGLKMTAILALQNKKIKQLTEQLLKNPLKHSKNIKKLKTIAGDVLYFTKVIKSHKNAVDQVNKNLDITISMLRAMQPKVKSANKSAGMVLKAIENAYEVAYNKI